jgi:hypothetical protein
MRGFVGLALCIVFSSAPAWAQTADELIAKNIQAKGGAEKIKAIKTLTMTGKLQQGGFVARMSTDSKAPAYLRQSFTVQGMTQIQAYDGTTGWQISPFQGRKDPERMGEDDMRDLVDQSDFYGPLVDYKEKGNTVEFLGHDTVDGDDALRLKVTLKNGDIINYYLDPDTFLEIRTELTEFIRGSVKESVTNLGSYKPVAGVYFPFSLEVGPKSNPQAGAKISFEKIEANIPLEDSVFKMPTGPAESSPQKNPAASGVNQ